MGADNRNKMSIGIGSVEVGRYISGLRGANEFNTLRATSRPSNRRVKRYHNSLRRFMTALFKKKHATKTDFLQRLVLVLMPIKQ